MNQTIACIFGLSEVDGDGDRIVILVSNVRDGNFYDPINNNSFTGGFFSSFYGYYGDRNFITIDSKQWDMRAGNTGHPTRAYTFDSTIAHELQHLIHADQSPNEETWLNEAMSEYAEFLVGFRTEDSHSRTQWQQWPENSLVLWGDQPEAIEILSDYQLGYLFALYTTGRIGGVYTDTAKLTQQSEDGIVGFNQWLSDIADAGNSDAVGLTFSWLLGPSYEFGDVVTSTVMLTDLFTGDVFDLTATADVGARYQILLPVVMRGFTQ